MTKIGLSNKDEVGGRNPLENVENKSQSEIISSDQSEYTSVLTQDKV